MQRYLYRGVNSELHKTNGGKLVPKVIGVPFKQNVYWGRFCWGDGRVFGESETNAVVQHQRDSSQNPTSGISTTPHSKTPSGMLRTMESTNPDTCIR